MYGNGIFYSAHFSCVREKLRFQIQGVRKNKTEYYSAHDARKAKKLWKTLLIPFKVISLQSYSRQKLIPFKSWFSLQKGNPLWKVRNTNKEPE